MSRLTDPARRTVNSLLRRYGYTLLWDDDYDDAAKEIIEAARPFTMTTHQRLYALWQSINYVARAGIEGAIVECGVWRGGSAYAAARALRQNSEVIREFYLYDTYTGMTAPSALDVNRFGQRAAQLMANARSDSAEIVCRAALGDVQALMEGSGYPAHLVHYVIGDVLETIPGRAPDKIAILRLDTDWYESTKHELEHLLPRVTPGGILLIDDYGYWQGARKAVDEYLADRKPPLLLNRVDANCRLAVIGAPAQHQP